MHKRQISIQHYLSSGWHWFDIAAKPENEPEVHQKLQLLHTQHLADVSHIEHQVGQGNKTEALRAEIARGNYELVIIDSVQVQTDTQVWQLLSESQIPVLYTPRAVFPIHHLLICTAAGEPGKSDVRFGGRLARRLGASVTLLHISQSDLSAMEKERVTTHLQQARDLVSTLGVPAQVKSVTADSPAIGILQMVQTGEYDMTIVGASAPPDPAQVIWNTLDKQLVAQIPSPILVVPMME